METVKLLKWIVGVLLLVNLLTIFFAWYNSFPPPHDRGNAAKFLSKELGFTDAQEEKYALLRKIHQRETRKYNERSMEMKKELYQLLTNRIEDAQVEKLMDSIGLYGKKAEMARFEHFQEVRKLCDEKQRVRFDQIIGEVIKMMSPPPPKRR